MSELKSTVIRVPADLRARAIAIAEQNQVPSREADVLRVAIAIGLDKMEHPTHVEQP